ncbi:MAG TPA: hypothetical protein VHM01_00460 [Alphaproteobacteria bacterium]|nr:hypothetical protein [Alphaproteobacteria bacterium]
MLDRERVELTADLGGNPAWRSAAPSEEDVVALLARANEGSRVLDGLVYCCVRSLIFRRVVTEEDAVLYYVDPENGFDEPKIRFPLVTLSVDAAVDAICADWRVASMRYFEASRDWVVSLKPAIDASILGQQLSEYGAGTHRSLPLAITIANLRARLGERLAARPMATAAPAASFDLQTGRPTS